MEAGDGALAHHPRQRAVSGGADDDVEIVDNAAVLSLLGAAGEQFQALRGRDHAAAAAALADLQASTGIDALPLVAAPASPAEAEADVAADSGEREGEADDDADGEGDAAWVRSPESRSQRGSDAEGWDETARILAAVKRPFAVRLALESPQPIMDALGVLPHVLDAAVRARQRRRAWATDSESFDGEAEGEGEGESDDHDGSGGGYDGAATGADGGDAERPAALRAAQVVSRWLLAAITLSLSSGGGLTPAERAMALSTRARLRDPLTLLCFDAVLGTEPLAEREAVAAGAGGASGGVDGHRRLQALRGCANLDAVRAALEGQGVSGEAAAEALMEHADSMKRLLLTGHRVFHEVAARGLLYSAALHGGASTPAIAAPAGPSGPEGAHGPRLGDGTGGGAAGGHSSSGAEGAGAAGADDRGTIGADHRASDRDARLALAPLKDTLAQARDVKDGGMPGGSARVGDAAAGAGAGGAGGAAAADSTVPALGVGSLDESELVTIMMGAGAKVKAPFVRTLTDALARYGSVRVELARPGEFPLYTGSPLSWARLAFMTRSDVLAATEGYAVLGNVRASAKQYAVDVCAAVLSRLGVSVLPGGSGDVVEPSAAAATAAALVTESQFKERLRATYGFAPWRSLCTMLGFSSPKDVTLPALLLEVTQAGWGAASSRARALESESGSVAGSTRSVPASASATGSAAASAAASAAGSGSGSPSGSPSSSPTPSGAAEASSAAHGGSRATTSTPVVLGAGSRAVPIPPSAEVGSGDAEAPLTPAVLRELCAIVRGMRTALPGKATADLMARVVTCSGLPRASVTDDAGLAGDGAAPGARDEAASVRAAFVGARKAAIVAAASSLPDTLGWVLATLPHLEPEIARVCAPWLLASASLCGQPVRDHHRVAGARVMSGLWLTAEQRVALAVVLNQDQPTKSAVLEQAVELARGGGIGGGGGGGSGADGLTDAAASGSAADVDSAEGSPVTGGGRSSPARHRRKLSTAEAVFSPMIGVVRQYGSPALLKQVLLASDLPDTEQARILSQHTDAIEALVLHGATVMAQVEAAFPSSMSAGLGAPLSVSPPLPPASGADGAAITAGGVQQPSGGSTSTTSSSMRDGRTMASASSVTATDTSESASASASASGTGASAAGAGASGPVTQLADVPVGTRVMRVGSAKNAGRVGTVEAVDPPRAETAAGGGAGAGAARDETHVGNASAGRRFVYVRWDDKPGTRKLGPILPSKLRVVVEGTAEPGSPPGAGTTAAPVRDPVRSDETLSTAAPERPHLVSRSVSSDTRAMLADMVREGLSRAGGPVQLVALGMHMVRQLGREQYSIAVRRYEEEARAASGASEASPLRADPAHRQHASFRLFLSALCAGFAECDGVWVWLRGAPGPSWSSAEGATTGADGATAEAAAADAAHGTESASATAVSGRADLAGGAADAGAGVAGITSRKTAHLSHLYKVSMCRHWERDGTCPFAERCAFAHGEAELRLYADGGVLAASSTAAGATVGAAGSAGNASASAGDTSAGDGGDALDTAASATAPDRDPAATTGEATGAEHATSAAPASGRDAATRTAGDDGGDAGEHVAPPTSEAATVPPSVAAPVAASAASATSASGVAGAGAGAGAEDGVETRYCYTVGEEVMFEEDLTHEFKRSLSADDTLKYVIAFLNTRGGTLYCGVENSGVVVGLPLDRDGRDALRLSIDQMLRNAIKPPVHGDLVDVVFVPVYPTAAAAAAATAAAATAATASADAAPAHDLFVVEIKVSLPHHGEEYLNRAFVARKGNVLYYRRQASVETIDTFAGLLEWYDHQRARAEEYRAARSSREKALEDRMRDIAATVNTIALNTPTPAAAARAAAAAAAAHGHGHGHGRPGRALPLGGFGPAEGITGMDGDTVGMMVMGGVGGGKSWAPPARLGVGMGMGHAGGRPMPGLGSSSAGGAGASAGGMKGMGSSGGGGGGGADGAGAGGGPEEGVGGGGSGRKDKDKGVLSQRPPGTAKLVEVRVKFGGHAAGGAVGSADGPAEGGGGTGSSPFDGGGGSALGAPGAAALVSGEALAPKAVTAAVDGGVAPTPGGAGGEGGITVAGGLPRVGMRGSVGPCDFSVALQQVYGSMGCRVMLVVTHITPGGQLWRDGRVSVGAQVLKINRKNAVGAHGETIAKLLSACKEVLFRTPAIARPSREVAAPTPALVPDHVHGVAAVAAAAAAAAAASAAASAATAATASAAASVDPAESRSGAARGDAEPTGGPSGDVARSSRSAGADAGHGTGASGDADAPSGAGSRSLTAATGTEASAAPAHVATAASASAPADGRSGEHPTAATAGAVRASHEASAASIGAPLAIAEEHDVDMDVAVAAAAAAAAASARGAAVPGSTHGDHHGGLLGRFLPGRGRR